MRIAYLMAYNDALGSREDVKRCLDEMPEVNTWRHDLPHCIYFVSELDARALSVKIRGRLGAGRFLITEVTSNKGCWLPNATWYLLKNKTLKPKE